MDYGVVIDYLQSTLVPVLIFIVLLIFAAIRGRRAITSLILGLYFALLISLKFPYYDNIYAVAGNIITETALSIVVFAVFTTIASLLMDRLLFYRIDERAFEGIGKKIILALLGTILVMAYSYHVLPITNLIDPGLPAQQLFGPPEYFFWWLVVPLGVLFFLI